MALRKKCPYLELFRSNFSRITPYLSVFSLNAGKYRPESLKLNTSLRVDNKHMLALAGYTGPYKRETVY